MIAGCFSVRRTLLALVLTLSIGSLLAEPIDANLMVFIADLHVNGSLTSGSQHQRDYYFNKPVPVQERPAFWNQRMKENLGETMSFPYPEK